MTQTRTPSNSQKKATAGCALQASFISRLFASTSITMDCVPDHEKQVLAKNSCLHISEIGPTERARFWVAEVAGLPGYQEYPSTDEWAVSAANEATDAAGVIAEPQPRLMSGDCSVPNEILHSTRYAAQRLDKFAKRTPNFG